MINNEDNKNKEKPEENTGYVDIAKMDVQCHLLIKDIDTNEILVNQRG